MQPDIAETECLAVFVFHSNEMKEDGVHWRAFLPAKDGERSCFRVDGLDFGEIAALADNRPNDTLRGWAAFTASEVRKLSGLRLRVDEPPERHVVIDSWPTESHLRRTLAMSLADAATTTRFPCAT